MLVASNAARAACQGSRIKTSNKMTVQGADRTHEEVCRDDLLRRLTAKSVSSSPVNIRQPFTATFAVSLCCLVASAALMAIHLCTSGGGSIVTHVRE
jgi:hypothetical protein